MENNSCKAATVQAGTSGLKGIIRWYVQIQNLVRNSKLLRNFSH